MSWLLNVRSQTSGHAHAYPESGRPAHPIAAGVLSLLGVRIAAAKAWKLRVDAVLHSTAAAATAASASLDACVQAWQQLGQVGDDLSTSTTPVSAPVPGSTPPPYTAPLAFGVSPSLVDAVVAEANTHGVTMQSARQLLALQDRVRTWTARASSSLGGPASGDDPREVAAAGVALGVAVPLLGRVLRQCAAAVWAASARNAAHKLQQLRGSSGSGHGGREGASDPSHLDVDEQVALAGAGALMRTGTVLWGVPGQVECVHAADAGGSVDALPPVVPVEADDVEAAAVAAGDTQQARADWELLRAECMAARAAAVARAVAAGTVPDEVVQKVLEGCARLHLAGSGGSSGVAGIVAALQAGLDTCKAWATDTQEQLAAAGALSLPLDAMWFPAPLASGCVGAGLGAAEGAAVAAAVADCSLGLAKEAITALQSCAGSLQLRLQTYSGLRVVPAAKHRALVACSGLVEWAIMAVQQLWATASAADTITEAPRAFPVPLSVLASLSEGAERVLGAVAAAPPGDQELLSGSCVASLAMRLQWWHRAAVAFDADVATRLKSRPTADVVKALLDSAVVAVVGVTSKAVLQVCAVAVCLYVGGGGGWGAI